MAKLDISGFEAVEQALLRQEERAIKAVPNMLKAGADVLIKAQKAEAENTFKSDRSTGDLADSIKSTPVRTTNTEKYVDVYPHGTDRHGVRNATKGFVLEYGRSNMDAKPWVSAARAKSEGEVKEAMKKVWEGG